VACHRSSNHLRSFCAGHGGNGDTPLSEATTSAADLAQEESRQLVLASARAADDKLGNDPVALDVAELLSVVDYFFVVSGRNERQVHAICDAIEERVKAVCARSPIRIEGLREGTWILMDYGDVVIHVFEEEARRYYDLEHLWNAAPRLALPEVSVVQSQD
jgi:ribosome-associated protein